jgi:hypothetical protein
MNVERSGLHEKHLGFKDRFITSPNGNAQLVWKYQREAPHGDGLFFVSLAGEPLPGEFWGRNLVWSEDGKLATLERKLPNRSELLVLEVGNRMLHFVQENCAAVRISEGKLLFKRYGDPKSTLKSIAEIVGRA